MTLIEKDSAIPADVFPEKTRQLVIEGLDHAAVREVLRKGIDHAGHPVQPFVDRDGGWPLRCCLSDSEPGERLAIVAFSPFPWTSAYRATGPVVIHAEGCSRAHDGALPEQFRSRRQILRAFGNDAGRVHTIVYDLGRIAEPGDPIEEILRGMLTDPRVEFVHSHNVLAGCFSFAARLG